LTAADDIILPALESGEGTSAAAICRDLGSSSNAHKVNEDLQAKFHTLSYTVKATQFYQFELE